MSITTAQQVRAAYLALTREDETIPYVVVDGISICHDCLHEETSHSISDPKGLLGYGMGNCGNCVGCALRATPDRHRETHESPSWEGLCAVGVALSAPTLRAASDRERGLLARH
jgi:hypothetical protein